MSKNEWSETQPPEWQGEEIGSHKPLPASAHWAPPVEPAIPATPLPANLNSRESTVGAMLNQSFSMLKALASSALGITALFSVLSSAVITAVGYALLPTDDVSLQIIRDVLNSNFTGENSDWLSEQSLAGTELAPLFTWAGAVSGVGLLLVILQTFVSAAIVRQSISFMREEKLSFAQAWSLVPRRNVWNLIFAFVGQISTGLAVLIALALLSSIIPGGDILFALAILAAVVFVAWYSIAVVVALPVSVDGEKSGFKAIVRSIQLIKGAWWRVLGLLIIFGLIFGLPLSTVAGIPSVFVTDPMALALVSLFTQTFISVFGIGYQAVVSSAIYRARVLAKPKQ